MCDKASCSYCSKDTEDYLIVCPQCELDEAEETKRMNMEHKKTIDGYISKIKELEAQIEYLTKKPLQ